jgi:chromate reductase, NAD(P)H dehydrogenase (quinone)
VTDGIGRRDGAGNPRGRSGVVARTTAVEGSPLSFEQPTPSSSRRVVDAPVRLLGLSGSLRRASANTAALRAAAQLAPAGVEVVLHPLDDVPLYHGDVEAREGYPESVVALRRAIAEADGLLLASPEYNWSTTAVLKNAIDWASRAPDAPLDEKPAALLSAAGGSGGRRAQAHLRDILAHNEVDLLDDAVQIPRASQHVEDGQLVTPEHRARIGGLVAALAERAVERRQAQAA